VKLPRFPLGLGLPLWGLAAALLMVLVVLALAGLARLQ
jgi:hypothetical protein